MNEVSVTITAGEGCEEHNHGLEYRSKLEHTHDTNKDTVIELVPYEKSYKEQINELMKPYIKERNEYTLKRKAAAWDRYNSGQIKTKPRNRDYPLIIRSICMIRCGIQKRIKWSRLRCFVL